MNTFGRLFRVSTFGESHGAALGCVIDGCPAGLALDLSALQAELDRRRPGQGAGASPRQEGDRVELLSGVHEGLTLGTPIAALIRNEDARPRDYEALAGLYRPGHADYTYEAKYGHRDPRGGGRASARETAARVIAGAVARQWLASLLPLEVVAWVQAVGEVEATGVDPERVNQHEVDVSEVRCPDPLASTQMIDAIDAARAERDSLGGVVVCVARGLPPGLGEPVFDKLPARLAAAALSLPASRGFEIGEGFRAARMKGSEHNDPLAFEEGRVRSLPNRAGGVLGGISTGESLLFRVAFKPVATIGQPQSTIDREGVGATLEARGRHDACVLPRAVPIVEAMTCLVLADLVLEQRARAGGLGPLGGPGAS
ncbi:MAG: chorismate synthase [Deltaproteobacteria bacterium]|nr:chorismate synthase [Deltaproteobacteria bacterium]